MARFTRAELESFRDQEVPRGAAHAWAAYGHIRSAEDSLDEQARAHASKSNPV